MSSESTLAMIELLLRYGVPAVTMTIREADVDNPTPEQIKELLIKKRTKDYFDE